MSAYWLWAMKCHFTSKEVNVTAWGKIEQNYWIIYFPKQKILSISNAIISCGFSFFLSSFDSSWPRDWEGLLCGGHSRQTYYLWTSSPALSWIVLFWLKYREAFNFWFFCLRVPPSRWNYRSMAPSPVLFLFGIYSQIGKFMGERKVQWYFLAKN